MGKNRMTSKTARRIQFHADQTGRNQGLKSIFKDYKKQGIILDEMIKIENNRKLPKKLK